MKLQLKQYLDRYVTFDDNEIDIIFEKLSVVSIKKKTFLLNQGDTCHHKYFIIEGLLRLFNTDEKGDEHIEFFAIENWWITNLDSFVNETPSLSSIQAIEDTTVLCVTKNNLEELYAKVPKLERVFRIITENMLIAIHRKNEFYMKQNSSERYYNMVKVLPDFVQRVPQYMIASYLSISPEYLSEIRKQHIRFS